MSPNVTRDSSERRAVNPPPVVNGVDPPLGGHLDLDGEVTSSRSMTAPTRVTSVPERMATVDVERERTGRADGSPEAPMTASDFLRAPLERTGGVVAPLAQSGGVTSEPGPSRPLQGQGPALSYQRGSGSEPADPYATAQRQPRSGDSVEYASVASSFSRRDQQPRIPSESQVPGTPLFDLHTMERLQHLHAAAPQLLGSSPLECRPRPPSTTSSDIQAEVRRQLSDVVAVYEEESRRLRSQVESLVAENYELRVQNQQESVQDRFGGPRQWLGNQGGFPSFGWLGRGLGSIIGGATPPPSRTLDLGQEVQAQPALPTSRRWTSWISPPDQVAVPLPPPPRPPLPASRPDGSSGGAMPPLPKPSVPPPPQPHHPADGMDVFEQVTPGVHESGAGESFWQPERNGSSSQTQVMGSTVNPEGDWPTEIEARALQPKQDDVMNVVLKGIAQLQDVVTELSASPKQGERPEAIKPGVTNLPELPLPGPESCLLFSDWIHNSRPPLSDVSDTSEELWEGVLSEAGMWYSNYLKLDPLSRLVSKPEPSEYLRRPRWARVSRRIETMILAALPSGVRQEVSASRVSGLLALVCRLYVVYAPGGISERELGLRHIQDPPSCTGVPETIEGLRKWKRWCVRMSELGGTLPDAALQVKALTKLTKNALQGYPDISFRVNLVRHNLQVDVNPDQDKIQKLHAQLLSEFEMIGHRTPAAKDQERPQSVPSPPPQAKVKGVEAQEPQATAPKPPKAPKQPPKPPPPVKTASAEGAVQGKPPCTFYVSPTGCKKGVDCNFEHNWSSIPFEDRKGRCKSCGAKGHKSSECKAGMKEGEPKGEG